MADAPEHGSAGTRYRLAAVWFADVVGYSDLAARNEPEALARVRAFQETVRTVVAAREGRVVKFLGDGALADFPNTVAAVEAALALPAAFRVRAGAPDAALRVGIHTGDVASTADGDLYGDGVNVAARLQAEADPGQVLASEAVWDQVRRHPGFGSVDLGVRRLKGVGPTRVRALRVQGASGEPRHGAGAGPPHAGLHRRRSLAFLGIGAIVALAGTGIATWVQTRGHEPARETAAADSIAGRRDTVVVVDTIVTSDPLAEGPPAPPSPPASAAREASTQVAQPAATTAAPPQGALGPQGGRRPGIVVPPRFRRRIAEAMEEAREADRPGPRPRRQPAPQEPPAREPEDADRP
jgi:class 3 adenylate cyclase